MKSATANFLESHHRCNRALQVFWRLDSDAINLSEVREIREHLTVALSKITRVESVLAGQPQPE